MTPAELVSFWNDRDARVNDEVGRIMEKLTERDTGTATQFIVETSRIPRA